MQIEEYMAERLKNADNKSHQELEKYWLNKFSGDLFRSAFHYDYKETVSNVRIIDSVEFRFSGEIFSRLQRFTGESPLNLYLVMTAGVIILLGRYACSQSSTKDIILGTPVLFQQRKGSDSKPINTVLALRNQYKENITFEELFNQVKESILTANEHGQFPLEELTDRLYHQVFGDDFPLFDVAVSLENIQDRRYIRHLNVNMIFSFFKTARYIDGVVEYNSSLFEKNTIKKLINQLTNLLDSVFSNIRQPLYQVDIFSQEEKKKLLEDFNDTKADYPKDKTLPEIFEHQVEKTPGHIALVFREQQLTYRLLNEKANQLAYLLRKKNLTPDRFSGLMMERSLEMIIAMLGILKAGGAYLPIDPEYPPDRICYLLDDSSTRLLLTQKEFEEYIDFDGGMIRLDADSIDREDIRNPDIVNTPKDLAYAIYTSGSTGKPKGVMIEHRSVINLAYSQKETFNIRESDRVLQFSSVGFDASVEQIYITLFSGATLVLIDKMTLLDMKKFERFIDDRSLVHIHAVPLFVGSIPVKKYTGLKRMISGGDTCPPSLVKNWIKYCDFCNEYGPTETTVTSIQLLVRKGADFKGLSIGRPLNNTFIYILGRYLELVPPGVPGELCIGGDGVARGYMNRPQLTAEKFVISHSSLVIGSSKSSPKNNDQCPMANDRFYRTGDLARWLPDGNLDFLGRLDFQVKIRGFRIETGEIENQLLTQAEQKIKEAVVMAREDSEGDKFLCAYIVAEKPIDISILTYTLSKNLPEYMIPAYFIQIEQIPLTSSGKLDRKALPDPQKKKKEAYRIAPRSEIEIDLAKIWAELLNLDEKTISIDDDFFLLGGHSLKVTVMLTEIHKRLNVKVVMRQVFEMPTIRKLGQCIKEAKAEEYVPIPLAEKREYYPQTSAQKRLFFIDQLGEKRGNTLYNMQMMDVYCKGIDKEKLESALRKLIHRHESLRTSFRTIEGEAVQVIHEFQKVGSKFEIEYWDIKGGAVQAIHEFQKVGSKFEIEYWETKEDGLIFSESPGREWTKVTGLTFMDVVEQFVRPFDLGMAPILRVGLINIWSDTQILMIDMHHIMSDGVSEVLFIKDLWALYDGEELPPLKVQYKDFAQWVTSEAQQKKIKKHEAFWLDHFQGEIPILDLPYDSPRSTKLNFDGDSYYFEISKEETKRIYTMAKGYGVTTYMILFSAFNILLSKLSGQEEIVVGTVTAGRGHADLQKIIGMFVETLAIRNYPRSDNTFREFLEVVKQRTLSAFENQDYPLEQLVSKVAQRKDASRNPLFDVVFSLENEAERTEEYLLEVLTRDKSNPISYNVKKSRFDLVLIGIEKSDTLEFNLEYNVQLFKLENIERFIIYFKKILFSVCRDMNLKISQIEILPDLERGILLYSLNEESEYPKNKTINKLFEEQVEKYPDQRAVTGISLFANGGTQGRGDDCFLTYNQLNVKANQVARVLREKGMKPDNLAAIMIEPCQEMIIGLMGILKAGGAFLPIKDGTPTDRIEYILQESGTRFLLSRQPLVEKISFKSEILHLDNAGLYSGDRENPRHVNTPADLAYVIYTSGSTGKPKGVMIIHRTLINLCSWHNKYYGVTSNDQATKYAGFGFDASVWEIFPYLIIGASIFIVPEEIKLDIDALNRYFQDNAITISFLPTQLCEQFMGIENASLRVLLTGGDKLKTFTKRNYQLYNNYGPTENTVVATSYLVTELTSNIPIGKPVYNNQIFILDKNGYLQPIGVPGELCIGGDSLARGYLNNPQLTQEKFIKNPFSYPAPWVKAPVLYRTGDLARWQPNGNIEFLGRIDYQVKVRGFRIELGEIENQLLHQQDVKEAVVMAREDSTRQKYLCAYIVPGKPLDISVLKEELAKKLPDYMVPSFFIVIDHIPLNANGKIDTGALPEPKIIDVVEYVAPTNEIEEILAKIWSQVLGLEKIGIDDNFFEIGGDSIKTILISAKLNKQQLSTNVSDFFSFPTIRKMAKHIKKVERIIYQGPVTGDVPLTPIQQWFFENDFTEKYHFNHFLLWYNEEGYDENIIKKVITKIVEHHDALRIVYENAENSNCVTQRNRGLEPSEGKLFDLIIIDLIKQKNFKEEMENQTYKINRRFNLKTGPLVKIVLFRTIRGDYLMIIIHHLVIDGISWRILVEDFEMGYQQIKKGRSITFEDKTDSFKDWSFRLKEYADSPMALKELDYWKKLEETEINRLPRDFEIEKEEKRFKNREFVAMKLDKVDTDNLIKEVNFTYNTEINDILLTALGMAVKRWSGNEKVLINLEGHGREGIIEDIDISRTVGWFTSQYPVLLGLKAIEKENIGHHLQQVKETLRRIPNKGIGYGILRYLTSPEKRENYTFKLQPEISFNYLGQLGEIIGDTKQFHPNFEASFSPEFNMDYAVDIYGSVDKSGLALFFNYNKYEYKKSNIESFVAYYKENLLKIISHCLEKKKEIQALGITPIEYHLKEDYERYREQVKQEKSPDMTIENDYRHILLTGSTGFLGSHLLHELVENTDAKLYLPIRGVTQEEAEERFLMKMNFYFGEGFYNSHKHRWVVIKADLSENLLGMDFEQYEHLCKTVDAIVHPAANVKHHGLYEELYRDNVRGTENLLELAVNQKLKDFHYISTISVGYGNIPGKDYILFTEYCHDLGQQIEHIYLRSKLEAEKRVLDYRKKGISCSIYRVGNLIFHSDTGKFQENIQDDYFYAIIKGAVKLELLSDDMKKMVFDMSFIDYTAKAITLLLTRKNLKNETYHLYNPNELKMQDMATFLRGLGYILNDIEQPEVENYLSRFAGDKEYEKTIELLKLHSWLFEEREGTKAFFKMDRTIELLKKLDFGWKAVNELDVEKMIAYCKEVDFL